MTAVMKLEHSQIAAELDALKRLQAETAAKFIRTAYQLRSRMNTRGAAFVHRATNCPFVSAGVTVASCHTAKRSIAYSSRVL